MPRTPKEPQETERRKQSPSNRVMGNGHDKGFQPGRARTGGRKPKADVWAMLQQAAEIANARATGSDVKNLTNELLIADLIDVVRRTAPDTALRVLVPTIYPKASVKPVNIEIDTSPEGLSDSLERVAQAMATGGDIAALSAVFNTLKAVQDARATALEMRALERELEQ